MMTPFIVNARRFRTHKVA